MTTTTRHVELTRGWTKVGDGPAYLDAQAITHVHFGDTAPEDDTKAFHVIGQGYQYGIATQAVVGIWARSGQPEGALVISEGA